MKRITAALLPFFAFPMMAAEPLTPLASPAATQPASFAVLPPTTQPGLTPAAMANVGVNTLGPAQCCCCRSHRSTLPIERTGSGGVQQNMLTDLSRAGGLQPITLDARKPENAPPAAGFDGDAAIRIARTQNADFVIYGTYQVADTDLRIIGVITDVMTGQPVGGIKATGPIREVFAMEDSLVEPGPAAVAAAGGE